MTIQHEHCDIVKYRLAATLLLTLCRFLSQLHLSGLHITKLPPLPPNSKSLDVFDCSSLQRLADSLPASLELLHCTQCPSLVDVPGG